MKRFIILLAAVALAACADKESQKESRTESDQLYNPEFRYIPAVLDDECYVYMDVTTGKRVPDIPRYQYASYFFEGIALVKQNDSLFYIDNSFKPISDARYESASIFSHGLALAAKPKGMIEAIDKKGKAVVTLDEYWADEAASDQGVFRFKKGSQYGFMDHDGMLSKANHHGFPQSIGSVAGGYAAIQDYVDGPWGVISLDGDIVVPMEYESADFTLESIRNERVVVKKQDLYGVVNLKGKEVIPCEYAYLYPDRNGTYLFKNKRGRYGWLDARGNELIEPEYDSFGSLFGDQKLAAVGKRERMGYINKEGEWVVKPKYMNACRFYDGIALVETEDYMWGVINTEGEYVVKPRYDNLAFLGDHLIVAYLDGEEGLIDFYGETVIKMSDRYHYTGWKSFPVWVSNQYLDVDKLVDELAVYDLYELNLKDKWKRASEDDSWSESVEDFGSYETLVIADYREEWTPDDGITKVLSSLTMRLTWKDEKILKNKDMVFKELARRLGRDLSNDGALGTSLVPGTVTRMYEESDGFSFVLIPDPSWEGETVEQKDDERRMYIRFSGSLEAEGEKSPIVMALRFTPNGASDIVEDVKGYYYYQSRSENNPINLSGSVYTDGRVSLVSSDKTETFEGMMEDYQRFNGTWTMVKGGQTTSLSFNLRWNQKINVTH